MSQEIEYRPIGLIAKDAAWREHPPEPGENDLREDIRNSVRQHTERDFLARLSTYLRQGQLQAVNPLSRAPFDPSLPHLDPSDPMWALDYGEEQRALELLGQLRHHNEAGHTGSTLQAASAHAALDAAKATRHASGFFTLREVAQMLADANSLRADKLLKQLNEAFGAGKLVVRDPDTKAPLSGGRVRDFYDWVTPDDVNRLLADIWRVPYRFPKNVAPPISSQTLDGDSPFSALTGRLHIRSDERLFALRDVPAMTARALVPGAAIEELARRAEDGDSDAAERRLLLVLLLDDHKQRLASACERGELVVTWARLPATTDIQEVMSLGELRKFCQSVQVELVVVGDDDASPAHPAEIAASVVPESTGSSAPVASALRHTLSTRRDVLDPIIDLAGKNATNPDDRAAVWNALTALAVSDTKPHPLLGFVDRTVQYLDGDEAKFLTRDAFNKRWDRRTRKAATGRR